MIVRGPIRILRSFFDVSGVELDYLIVDMPRTATFSFTAQLVPVQGAVGNTTQDVRFGRASRVRMFELWRFLLGMSK